MIRQGRALRGRPASPLRTARFQGIQVPLGVQPVFPLFVEDDEQALAHWVAAGLRPARSLDWFGVAVECRDA